MGGWFRVTGVTAADRLHIKYCRDSGCRIEHPADPGDSCENMEYLIREIGKESETPEDLLKTSVAEKYMSLFRITLALDEDVEDVSNPNLPGSETVRARLLSILAYPDESGWSVSLISVIGPKVSKAGGSLSKRNYDIPFSDPLGPHTTAPLWAQEIVKFWENRLNGKVPGGS
jgi:hypothetical protein